MPTTTTTFVQADVGTPVPFVPHAVSVSLPTWKDNVDYEEGAPRITELMQNGYPRFFIHKKIQELAAVCEAKFASPSEKCLLVPTSRIAERCRDFIRAQSAEPLNVSIVHFRILTNNISDAPSRTSPKTSPDPSCTSAPLSRETSGGGAPASSSSTSTTRPSSTVSLHIVLFPSHAFPLAKAFWQHTGDGISSRMAERCLELLKAAEREEQGRQSANGTHSVASSLNGSGIGANGNDVGGMGDTDVAATSRARNYSRNRHYSKKGFQVPGPGKDAFPALVASPSLPSSRRGFSASHPTLTMSDDDDLDEGKEAADDTFTSDHSVYVEERYGRNLPLSSAPLAKRALRRRIAGVLAADAFSSGSASTHAPEASLDCMATTKESARGVAEVTEEDVFLFPTGMNSIWHAHRVARMVGGEDVKSICFGFPYTDTLKVLQKWGAGCVHYGHGLDADLDDLEAYLSITPRHADSKAPAPFLALFCEFPSNPLLRSPNLRRIRALADKYGFIIVVDETVGNMVNVEVLPWADIVVSSLTKVFSGDTNVMGGSMVLNPRSSHYASLRTAMAKHYEDAYWPEDAIYMERNSRDFVGRVQRINANTEALCDRLKAAGGERGPTVIKAVYYPKYETPEHYDACRRRPASSASALSSSSSSSSPLADQAAVCPSSGGYGGLFSVTFVSSAASEAFFDALDVYKGPSLGTNFTLASPYTILAHYAELDWAAGFGVERNLVRVSVGMEDKEWLFSTFDRAVEAAQRAHSRRLSDA